ncbi:MAG: hypothetical protein ABI615_01240 [Chthoniobacterales bacterium]
MINKRFLLVLALVVPLSGFAQQGVTQEDMYLQEILKRLENIRNRQSSVKIAEIRAALQKLEPIANSSGGAVNFYEDAVKATRYDGKQNGSQNFEEWRKKEVQNNRAITTQTALQLHLRYLILSLKWSGTENKAVLMPELKAYLRSLEEAEKTFRRPPPLTDDGKKFLTDSIANSMFVAWLKLGPLLPEAATWESIPSNIGGILEKSIRPELRKEKKQELIETWNEQIQLEADRVTNLQLKMEIDKFNTVKRPQLLWDRAQDLLVLGNTKQGYSEMIQVIESNPTHADQEKWITKLETLISKEKAARAPAAPAEEEAAPIATPAATPVATPVAAPAVIAAPTTSATTALPAATPAPTLPAAPSIPSAPVSPTAQ